MQRPAKKGAQRLGWIFGFILIAFNCTERDRANPLDPQNPDTGGVVKGLSVLSEERRVELSWNPLSLTGLDSIHVYRRSEGEDFRRISSLPPESQQFDDTTVFYDRSYEYYITARSGRYETPPSARVAIRPGPTYTWVADGRSGYLTRLTHDLQYRLSSYGILQFPFLVEASPRERSAWIFSRFSESLYKVNGAGIRELSLSRVGSMTSMALDSTTLELWMAFSEQGRIMLMNRNGELLFVDDAVQNPEALAVDSRRHLCWIADRVNRRVVRLTRTGQMRDLGTTGTFVAPTDLMYDEYGGSLWIADSTRVLNLRGYSGEVEREFNGFFNAARIIYDAERSACWIADFRRTGEPGALLKIDLSGNILLELDSFGFPWAVELNRYDGSVLVGDIGYGGLWRISHDGSSVEQIAEIVAPYDISIEHH